MPSTQPAGSLASLISTPTQPRSVRPRLDSVDLLRGLVMVIMALDHTRDFFSKDLSFDPTDLSRTYPALFLTRWITHYCAPVFMFLAGTSAFLSTTRGRTKKGLSWFLLTRGAWLVVLELTWVRCLGWQFNFDYHFSVGAVIWALGWSMIALAGLVFLALPVITALGVLMVATHNLFDPIAPESLGSLGWLWQILHTGGPIDLGGGVRFVAAYPLIPWMGVMAAGYGFGSLLLRQRVERRKKLFLLGGGLTLLFVLLRVTNLYGDPGPWTPQKDALFTIFSFLNCQKYPPSLSYLLMTLGPALLVLALLDRETPRWLEPILVFGRVPLFYYVLHLPLIHGLSVLVAFLRHGRADWLFGNSGVPAGAPTDFGFGLPIVYLVWVSVVLSLYPVCHWFSEVKRRRHDWWLSYL